MLAGLYETEYVPVLYISDPWRQIARRLGEFRGQDDSRMFAPSPTKDINDAIERWMKLKRNTNERIDNGGREGDSQLMRVCWQRWKQADERGGREKK